MSAPSSTAPSSTAPLPRLALRDDAVVLPAKDCLRIVSRTGTHVARGAGIEALHAGIAPVLDGTRTRNDVLSAVPDTHRALVTTYLDQLVASAAVSERRETLVSPPSAPRILRRDDADRTGLDGADACVFVVDGPAAGTLLLHAGELLDTGTPVRILVRPDTPNPAVTDRWADHLGRTACQDGLSLTVHVVHSATHVERTLAVPAGTDRTIVLKHLPERLGIGRPAHRRQLPVPSATAQGAFFPGLPDRFDVHSGRLRERLVTDLLAAFAPPAEREGEWVDLRDDCIAAESPVTGAPAGSCGGPDTSRVLPVAPARTRAGLFLNAIDAAAQTEHWAPCHEHSIRLTDSQPTDTDDVRHLRALLRASGTTPRARRSLPGEGPVSVRLTDGRRFVSFDPARADHDALLIAVLEAYGVDASAARLDGWGHASAADARRDLRRIVPDATPWLRTFTSARLAIQPRTAWDRTAYTGTLKLERLR